jgi:nitrite reductase/ring-hydroxylating ferredoxin subunit
MTLRLTLSPEQASAMAAGEFVHVDLPRAFDIGEPPDRVHARSVLVGRAEGVTHVYANVCRHREVPLDFGADTAMSFDGRHLLCHQHGAMYRPSDGACVGGPCAGAKLIAIPIEREEPDAIVLAIG